MEEQWKAVVGYEGIYEVSSHGRVRSVDREITYTNRYGGYTTRKDKGRLLTPCMGHSYLTVTLCDNKGKRRCNSRSVHTLVAKAFIDKHDWADRVNHKDLDKLNNHIDNLEWTDSAGNMRHAVDNGRQLGVKGEGNYHAVLTEEDVRWMRSNVKGNGGTLTRKEIAKKMNISISACNSAIIGTTWKHVK